MYDILEENGTLRRTPAGNVLAVPTKMLKEAVEAEWQGAKKWEQKRFPLTMHAYTVLDKLCNNRDQWEQEALAFIDTDTLCYHLPATNTDAEVQYSSWQPVLQFLQQRLDIGLEITHDIAPIQQSEQVRARISAYIHELDAWQLLAMHLLTHLYGSCLLAIAVMEKHVNAVEGWQLSQLEVTLQEARWGSDEEAKTASKVKAEEVQEVARWIDLLPA